MCQYDPGYIEYNPLALQPQRTDPWTGKEWQGDPLEVITKRKIYNNLHLLQGILGVKRVPDELVEQIAKTIANYRRNHPL
jgi:hypothetical protein